MTYFCKRGEEGILRRFAQRNRGTDKKKKQGLENQFEISSAFFSRASTDTISRRRLCPPPSPSPSFLSANPLQSSSFSSSSILLLFFPFSPPAKDVKSKVERKNKCPPPLVCVLEKREEEKGQIVPGEVKGMESRTSPLTSSVFHQDRKGRSKWRNSTKIDNAREKRDDMLQFRRVS